MSEFSLIHTHFKTATAKHSNTILGIGDDCAISTIPSDCELVSCVDTLVAGRHFVFETSPYAIGYKSVAVNLSDLASMGATPYAILLGLSLPSNDNDWLKAFSRGIADICKKFNVELIGGDTTKSDILTISITALGFIQKGKSIKRNNAKIGDVICVSGHIGSASLVLSYILGENGYCKYANALDDLNDELKTALQYPTPQIELGQKLIGYAHSMIDISDGLGQDLGHILNASGVGAKLYLDNIPCADELNALPFDKKYQHILNGGDDYQLCFTMSKDNFDKFNQLYPNLIYQIGEIVEKQGLELFFNNQPVDFEIKGWEHF
ncbi:thiamine-phosphate kinase [Moraxella sp. ZY210820]|uniref:thiamine-phosphate kinase n=1 Tax=unclassified Moraxella TaxID=2685852 RepID=UPI002730FD27|nr:thiamine-phosphate kinase [Moraxella sp. ZY210820]WLF84101.1 thiamine-phosphate kinase [Moraxella sp. ZY210820]